MAGNSIGTLRRGLLAARGAAVQASWGDLFAWDYVDDGMHVDIAKVQMFFFTVILAFGYAAAVANVLIHATAPVTDLPKLNSAFVTLLGISQGGYLGKKIVKGRVPSGRV